MPQPLLKTGVFACYAAFVCGLLYTLTTIGGFISLNAAQEPIGDPYFTIMECLILFIAFAMLIAMAAVYNYALPASKPYALLAFVCMVLTCGITSCVHFTVLSMRSVSDQIPQYSYFFSFTWPSVIYALDILAWDWFFALAMLFAMPVFNQPLRRFMLLCGLLSLAGLAGVPLENMQVRNIGIVGYAVLAPLVFLMIGRQLAKSPERSQ